MQSTSPTVGAHRYLTNKCDWLLAHRMRITNVGLDDLTKRLLHPLWTPTWYNC